jgi:hypothetical protein
MPVLLLEYLPISKHTLLLRERLPTGLGAERRSDHAAALDLLGYRPPGNLSPLEESQ